MFERFFHSPKNPEEGERLIQKVVGQELSLGINAPMLWRAFKAAQKENKTRNLGMTNNQLLNITKDMAIGLSGEIEDSMYGGLEQTIANINKEIEKLRDELTDEERGN
ncbi:MAG: hypothetical protein HYT65_00980 [Candidatus Yanofskybacteria bacterium]|nr:hypothetical protein [Candidatus Yanofskybacteria bacterium]